jgi:hypothetical protein
MLLRTCAAAIALACAGSAVTAATVSYAITGTVTRVWGDDQGLLGTTGTGTLSYDESRIDPLDQRLVGPDVDLSLTIFGTTWDETSDDNYPHFPWIEFVDNEPTFLDFTRSVDIPDPRIDLFYVISDFAEQADGSLAFDIGVQAIPLPAALPLALGGVAALGLIGLLRRAGA